MKHLLDKQKLVNLILILYTLSIILDLHIFYNSISTLIRVVIISLLFLLVFLKFANKKERKYILLYFCVSCVYIVFHMLNLRESSIFAECLYFVKMFMPALIVFIVLKLDISLNHLKKIVNPCLLMISGSIVFCNIFKLGYSTYSFDPLKDNIFSWFGHEYYEYYDVSGKGYFDMANQIIGIILLYIPIVLLKIKEKINFYDVCTLATALLSLLMLGNRISSGAPVIILIVTIVLYSVLCLIRKEKINVKYIACLLIFLIGYSLVLSKSPLIKREEFYDNLTNDVEINEENESVEDNLDPEEIILSGAVVNINFPKYYYPYHEDVEFWNELLTLPDSLLIDSRFIEIKIVQRLIELNDNYFKDKLLGIGYDRIINIQNIEKDFVMQYYSIGIIGTLLFLGIYFAILCYIGIKIFINLENKLTFDNLMLLMAISIVLVAAYFSGNLLNSMSVIIPLAFILGVCLNEIKKTKNKSNKVLGFNVCDLSEKQIIKKLKEHIRNGEQNIIFNINPLIVTNFYNNPKIIDEFNRQKYNIPDGIGTVLAIKMKNGTVSNRIAGIDFVDSLVKMAEKSKLTIYLYGSKEGIAKSAKINLENRYKKLKIVGAMSGYGEEKKALEDILKKKPDILFVALGSPKQELFIINNKEKLKNIKIIMPVGGTLDVISGSVKRAPIAFSKYHIEWLYRMLKEPIRIKQNLNLLKFVFLVIFKNNCYNKKGNGVNNNDEKYIC